MKRQRIIFIGPLGGNNPKGKYNGATIKNQQLVRRLKDLGLKVSCINTQTAKILWIKVFLLFKAFFFPNLKIIVSASFKGAYKLLTYLPLFINGNRIFYWVIGGALAEKIQQNNLNIEKYKNIARIIVEGEKMALDLRDLGLDNTYYLPNFKALPTFPIKKNNSRSRVIKFVFLSRIIPEKGCDIIFEACRILRNKELPRDFIVNFFGPIDTDYKEDFFLQLGKSPNLNYNGCLNLNLLDNYKILGENDVFLFPTFWPTEGFPGSLIDAFIAGLPVLATDWNLNGDIVSNGQTGYLLPIKDSQALAEQMLHLISNPEKVEEMCQNCLKTAVEYDINTIISESTLRSIGLLK